MPDSARPIPARGETTPTCAGTDYELATHDRWHEWRLDHPEELGRIVERLGFKNPTPPAASFPVEPAGTPQSTDLGYTTKGQQQEPEPSRDAPVCRCKHIRARHVPGWNICCDCGCEGFMPPKSVADPALCTTCNGTFGLTPRCPGCAND